MIEIFMTRYYVIIKISLLITTSKFYSNDIELTKSDNIGLIKSDDINPVKITNTKLGIMTIQN